MTKTRGTGMLAVWCDIPKTVEHEFNRWYNEEHVYERLSVPGVLSAARYESVVSGPKHLAVYELESPDVLKSDEYLNLRNNPSDWSKRMSPEVIGTTFIRNIYQQIFPEHPDDKSLISPLAEALQIGRMNIPMELEDEWNHWYNNVYVPNYETVSGVIRGRRYRAISGQPAYMTFYEMESPETSRTDEWFKQQTAHPSNPRMRKAMQHVAGSPGIWVKTFDPK